MQSVFVDKPARGLQERQVQPEKETLVLNKIAHGAGLAYPFQTPPSGEQVIEVAPGILWFRLSLPFQLNHVNLYLVADDDGYVLIDTGLGNRRTLEMWENLLKVIEVQAAAVGCAGRVGAREVARGDVHL